MPAKPKKEWYDLHEAALLSGRPESGILKMCTNGLLPYKPLISKRTLTKILGTPDFMLPEVAESDYENIFSLDKSRKNNNTKNHISVPNVTRKAQGYQIQIRINGVCRTKYLSNTDSRRASNLS